MECKEQHVQGNGNVRPPKYNQKNPETTVDHVICGNTERVNDVVMASNNDHCNGVEADLGHSMKLPKKGSTQNLPGVVGHTFAK